MFSFWHVFFFQNTLVPVTNSPQSGAHTFWLVVRIFVVPAFYQKLPGENYWRSVELTLISNQ